MKFPQWIIAIIEDYTGKLFGKKEEVKKPVVKKAAKKRGRKPKKNR